MKKIQFAIQVMGLIAMIPIVLVLEMNHVSRKSFEDNLPSIVKEKTEMKNGTLSGKRKDKIQNEPAFIISKTLLLKGI